jgi:hypothetical protein
MRIDRSSVCNMGHMQGMAAVGDINGRGIVLDIEAEQVAIVNVEKAIGNRASQPMVDGAAVVLFRSHTRQLLC